MMSWNQNSFMSVVLSFKNTWHVKMTCFVFLCVCSRSTLPVPGSHSFAGVSAAFTPPSAAPRAHTEVLQYRDWTPGGHGRGQGSSRGQSDEGRQQVSERTAEETLKLQQTLVQIFPNQESVIIMILQCHPTVRDINRLTDLILEQQD